MEKEKSAAEWIRKNKLIVIVRGIESKKCAALSEALYAGGIRLIEVTFDQKSQNRFCETTAAIAALQERWKEQICIGAGTVLTMEQLFLAKQAGARYIVTPNTNTQIIREAKKLGMAVAAGAMTPTEIEEAYEAGADFVRVFPAGSLGCGYFQAVKSPLSHIPMLAVGGINEENAAAFMKSGAVGVGVGGNLVNKQWIDNGEFEKITEFSRKYVENMGM